MNFQFIKMKGKSETFAYEQIKENMQKIEVYVCFYLYLKNYAQLYYIFKFAEDLLIFISCHFSFYFKCKFHNGCHKIFNTN